VGHWALFALWLWVGRHFSSGAGPDDGRCGHGYDPGAVADGA
jgi:hypothetical protein